MRNFDRSSDERITTATTTDVVQPGQASEVPPVGITPPQVLAQEAAAGHRGSAWRLMHWIMMDDPRAVMAVASLDDDRLVRNLLEYIAVGTWAGKPFNVPAPLRSAHARTRLRTLFFPGAGMRSEHVERILLSLVHDQRPSVRATAAHILGIIGDPTSVPPLIQMLQDPDASVRMQAAKALGRTGDSSVVPVLLDALHSADEQMGSQIFLALISLGHRAVPALIAECPHKVAWVRWHCMRALGEIGDPSAIPTLVQGLRDSDHSVAWVAAKSLTRFGERPLSPVLRFLRTSEVSPWIVETASYVLRNMYRYNLKLKPYLVPVLQSMHGVVFQIATPQAAGKAHDELIKDGLLKG